MSLCWVIFWNGWGNKNKRCGAKEYISLENRRHPPLLSIEMPLSCLYNWNMGSWQLYRQTVSSVCSRCLSPFSITVIWVLGSYTDRQLVQYAADRAVIQTGESRLNLWRLGVCLPFSKDIYSLCGADGFETIQILWATCGRTFIFKIYNQSVSN